MRTQQVIWTSIFSSIFGAAIALLFSHYMWQPSDTLSISERQKLLSPANSINYKGRSIPEANNFSRAAQKVTPAVVHIKTSSQRGLANYEESPEDNFWERFQSPNHPHYRNFPQHTSGSGVIISDNGYIATNYHVIEDAGHLEVILNDKRSFIAEVVGTDPSTDLALLKINAQNLPFAPYAPANKLQIGEWVLAIGNPFDLTSTVTAGIVSAKGRSINLLKNNYAIEAFIQTDAAVNPGNSGGALVNLEGELVGINTAIATQTGYYSGYSFAVPIGIVRKVMDDLKKYGEPQRALLGITILNIDADFASRQGLESMQGVFVESVRQGGAAQRAGLKDGDIIQKINGEAVNSPAELQSNIAMQSPGDRVQISYFREGKKYRTTAVLRDIRGQLSAKTRDNLPKLAKIKLLGAEFQEMTNKEKAALNIDNGVRVNKITNGKIKEAGIQAGFIITHFGEQKVDNPQDLERILANKKRIIAIEGIYPNGNKAYYAIGAE